MLIWKVVKTFNRFHSFIQDIRKADILGIFLYQSIHRLVIYHYL